MSTYIPYARIPARALELRFAVKKIEKRLLVSSRVYHRVIVKKEAGINPDSQRLTNGLSQRPTRVLQCGEHIPEDKARGQVSRRAVSFLESLECRNQAPKIRQLCETVCVFVQRGHYHATIWQPIQRLGPTRYKMRLLGIWTV